MVCVSNYGLLPCRSNRQRYRRREAECAEREISKKALGSGTDKWKIAKPKNTGIRLKG